MDYPLVLFSLSRFLHIRWRILHLQSSMLDLYALNVVHVCLLNCELAPTLCVLHDSSYFIICFNAVRLEIVIYPLRQAIVMCLNIAFINSHGQIQIAVEI